MAKLDVRPDRPPEAPEGSRLRRRPLASANWPLLVGATILLLLVALGIVGPLFVRPENAEPGAVPFSEVPSAAYPLGTDGTGRDLLTLMLEAIIPTLVIGVISGLVGTAIGAFLGLATGYFRGPFDNVVRSLADVMLTIPSLVVLIVIAAFVRTTTIELMALIIAIFSWPFSARTIRAQTLSMRELAFVRLAKLSGRGDLSIIVRDLFPNLLPFIAAGLVGSVSGGILASVGLQLLGLGPITTPTMGLVLQSAFQYGAVIQGLWWWWGPPTVVLAFVFIGLFLVSVGIDQYANPRLRQRVG